MSVTESVEVALAHARPVTSGGAFARVLAREALEDARRADEALSARQAPRPLEGVPLAVKDIVAVAGQPIGAGSRSRADAPAEQHDASIVARLRGAGAVVVGLAALHELAFGVTGVNHWQGTPANPLEAARVPGGSSSGSAVAVASGACELAVGTDTGGSCRIPAAFCDVVGFKPARREYSTDGVLALAPSLDHVGLLASSVAVLRRAHRALGHDAPAAVLPERVAVDACAVERSDPAVATAIGAAIAMLARAGCEVAPAERLPEASRVGSCSTSILYAEAANRLRACYESAPELLGRDVRARIEHGLSISPAELAASRADAARIENRLAEVLAMSDVLVGPTVPCLAPALASAADASLGARLVGCTRIYNLAGVAAISLPIPGHPGVGLQLGAASSGRLLAAAAAVEAVLAGAGPGSRSREQGDGRRRA